MKKKYNYDVHVAAKVIPQNLISKLLSLGYSPKPVLGGDPRVRIEHLLTIHSGDRATADTVFEETVALLQNCEEFRGYVEEEIVLYDLKFQVRDGGTPAVVVSSFPEVLEVSECPPHVYKACDIHVTVSGSSDLRVMDALRAAGFYFLSLDKKDVGLANVVTIQLEDLVRGKRVWKSLIPFLEQADGFDGFAKFEVTANIRSFGFALPPLVLKQPLARLGDGHRKVVFHKCRFNTSCMRLSGLSSSKDTSTAASPSLSQNCT